MHAMTEVTSPGGREGLGVEIQKIEGYFEEQHQSTKLRTVSYAPERRSFFGHALGRDRQTGNSKGNIESPRVVFKHDKDHKSEHKRWNAVQECETGAPPQAEQALYSPFAIEDKPTHTLYDHSQDDHPGDRTPKTLHRTTQDVTSKKICAQCVTIAWGKELITTVNFHRIVEHERWRPQGDRTENQEAPEARIDCSGGESRAWRRGVG